MPVVLLLALLACVGATPLRAASAEILRDEFGIPHIFASSSDEAAYAVGYAQAEDRLDALLEILLDHSDESIPQVSADMRRRMEFLADGVNRYIADRELEAAPVTAGQLLRASRHALDWIEGSGDVIMAGDRTDTGAPIAILDPWGDWNAPNRPYAMRVTIGTELALSGVAPVGIPFPLIGHSREIAVGWGPVSEGSEGSSDGLLDEAWALITATNAAEARQALAMQQINGTALVATAEGEIFDSGGATPFLHYLMRPRDRRDGTWSKQADAGLRNVLGSQNTWPFGRMIDVAFSTEVAFAAEWQRLLARLVPELETSRQISGWIRRAEVDSIPARAFYRFKKELGREAELTKPPGTLSVGRLRSALQRVYDFMGRQSVYSSPWGVEFRAIRDGGRESYPVAGGTVTDAGMETPRTIWFEPRGSVNMAVGGQTATQIVELSRNRETPLQSTAILLPGESDHPASPHFDDQLRQLYSVSAVGSTYFDDREALERKATSRIELEF